MLPSNTYKHTSVDTGWTLGDFTLTQNHDWTPQKKIAVAAALPLSPCPRSPWRYFAWSHSQIWPEGMRKVMMPGSGTLNACFQLSTFPTALEVSPITSWIKKVLLYFFILQVVFCQVARSVADSVADSLTCVCEVFLSWVMANGHGNRQTLRASRWIDVVFRYFFGSFNFWDLDRLHWVKKHPLSRFNVTKNYLRVLSGNKGGRGSALGQESQHGKTSIDFLRNQEAKNTFWRFTFWGMGSEKGSFLTFSSSTCRQEEVDDS